MSDTAPVIGDNEEPCGRYEAAMTDFECCESAANGPSPTPWENRQDRIRSAAAVLRLHADEVTGLWYQVEGALLADLMDAAAAIGSHGELADANDRMARSILEEPGDGW